MYQRTRHKLVICLTMIASVSLATASGRKANSGTVASSVVAAAPAGDAVLVETTDLQPFTNTAYIPAGADLSSIRFERAKAVKVATTRTSTTDRHYCSEGFREPGGSAYCPDSRDGSPAPGYEVTYSFSGPPLGSDEYGNTRFTFSVYFRPYDLDPALLQELSAHKVSRSQARDYFKLSISRGLDQEIAIDERNSAFCAGNYIDGLWTHDNPNCEDKVAYQTVAVPSSYIAVKVDPVTSPIEQASADRSAPERYSID